MAESRSNVQRCPWCRSLYRNMIGDDLWWQCGSRSSRQSWGCSEIVKLREQLESAPHHCAGEIKCHDCSIKAGKR